MRFKIDKKKKEDKLIRQEKQLKRKGREINNGLPRTLEVLFFINLISLEKF